MYEVASSNLVRDCLFTQRGAVNVTVTSGDSAVPSKPHSLALQVTETPAEAKHTSAADFTETFPSRNLQT